jgi:threonine dehydrogenase-like Zn-dependent dehydrogenase/FMN phosphatase YigB (HAD superfamily)
MNMSLATKQWVFCWWRWMAVLAVLVVAQPSDFFVAARANERELVLVIDVDNTLYCDEDLQNKNVDPPVKGIEEQIVKNILAYCEKHVSMDRGEADQLHLVYGSTIEGLRHTEWKHLPSLMMQEQMKHCYKRIYGEIDYSALLQMHQPSSNQLATGYSHQGSQITQLRDLLETQNSILYLASNSPSWHIRKVVQALGLMKVPWTGIVTPDQEQQSLIRTSIQSKYHVYPTKHSPSIFYQNVLHRNKNIKSANSNVILLDDSKTNIEALPEQLMRGIHVNKDNPVIPAILQAMGVIALPQSPGSDADTDSYQFSQVKYLQTKNMVDAKALHRPTWATLAKELRALLRSSPETELQIVDVGAGMLAMLKLILNGHEESLMPSIISLLLEDCVANKALFTRIRYFAYEPNRELQSQCIEILEEMGFVRHSVDEHENEHIFLGSSTEGHEVELHLRLFDYNDDIGLPCKPDPHLIVGCCFADLMNPYHLVPSLIHRFLSHPSSTSSNTQLRNDCLFYFPITFQGITQFIPPQPFQTGKIPSDTVAFALYSKALEEQHGHNLDPYLLINAIEAFGGTVLSHGHADWDIDPKRHPYLWETMLYFFERVAGPELLKNGWDAVGWLDRARRAKTPGTGKKHGKGEDQRPSILVSNLDLLFRMPRLGCAKLASEGSNESIDDSIDEQEVGIEEIQFVAPHKVTTARKLGVSLGPKQVQIRSEYSLISSGTELKIFKGLFDDAALDVNIKGMEEERMAYPLSYGYSLVGRVVQCGSEVEDADELIGKLVFTFSAHASHVIADRTSVQIVPEGIDAQDAIFMPSVETACSIIHDAHIRLGENVAVFGQGLIGLLVTSILSSTMPQKMVLQAPCAATFGKKLGTLTTFDAIPARLAASAAMGASQALLPSEVTASGPFDVAIEVSGNSRALQSAIDNTVNHGRLIIGSWYGNAQVALKLGIDFHRSHKTITTSQVSEIKAELSGLWTKERRFALTWELVKTIRPSRLITLRTSLDNAQQAYDALDKGNEIAVAFDYTNRK